MKRNARIYKIAIGFAMSFIVTGCGIGSNVEGSVETSKSAEVQDKLDAPVSESSSAEVTQENDTDATVSSEEETQADETEFADIIRYQIATKTYRNEYDGNKKFANPDMDSSNGVLFEGKFVTVMMPEEYAQTYPAMYETLNSIAKTEMEEADKHAEEAAQAIKSDYEEAIDNGYGFMGSYWYKEGARIARADDVILSIKYSSDEFAGGFHNDYREIGKTYDVQSGKEIALNDVISCSEEELNKILAEKLYASAVDDHQFEGLEEILSHYKFNPKEGTDKDDYENAEFPYIWYLAGDGLHIVFNAYDIAAYVYGSSDILIGYKEYDGLIDEKYHYDSNQGYITFGRTFLYGDDDDDEVEGIKMSCNYDDEAGLAKSLTLALNGKSATLEHPFPLDGDYIEYYKVHSFAGTDFIDVIVNETDDSYELFSYEITDDIPKAIEAAEFKKNVEILDNGFILHTAYIDPNILYMDQTGDTLVK